MTEPIDWRLVWEKFYEWSDEEHADDWALSWEKQMEAIQRIVNAQLRRAK